jgi:CubicO group peptidase (beta-lactamase class C family)
MIKHWVYSWLFVVSIALPCVAATKTEKMEEVINSYYVKNEFMGAVLVAQGDETIFSKAYGSANLEWSIPNALNTKFRLGAVTQQFTAASILLLESQGKLKTDDLVKKYLPSAPEAWSKITILHLLTHSSGIPDFALFPEFQAFQQLPTTAEKTMLSFRDKPLEFLPGEKMSYSNSGYIVLGALIEKVSGKNYATFLQDNIFAPLNMSDSGYDATNAIIPRRAAGYTPTDKGLINANYIDTTVFYSAGALHSTVEDLLKWEKGLFSGKLLSANAQKKMITSYKNDYGLGLTISVVKNRTLIKYDGRSDSFNAALAYYPDDKITVVVLGNIGGHASQEIAAALGGIANGEQVLLNSARKEVVVPIDTLKKYLGSYQFAPDMNMVITLDGDQLMIELPGQSKFPLLAESPTRFFVKEAEAQIEFESNSVGFFTNLVLRQGDNNINAKKL